MLLVCVCDVNNIYSYLNYSLAAIETHMGIKMEALEYVKEEDVLPILNRVSTASRTAKLNMHQSGFDDQIAKHRRRNKQQRKKSKKYVE